MAIGYWLALAAAVWFGWMFVIHGRFLAIERVALTIGVVLLGAICFCVGPDLNRGEFFDFGVMAADIALFVGLPLRLLAGLGRA